MIVDISGRKLVHWNHLFPSPRILPIYEKVLSRGYKHE